MSEPLAKYAYFDRHTSLGNSRQEVLSGLRAPQKKLSPKFFYDEDGSRLFEEITRLPEYYLTRTELAIIDRFEEAIRKAFDGQQCIVEYGSGSNLKIRRLLEIVEPEVYVPVDISGDHLQANALALQKLYPHISVYPVCADFMLPVELPPQVADLSKMAFFPGSSIGNFHPPEAVTFLQNVASTVGSGGQLLIGVDCSKPSDVLERAYDDSQGVTAEFNLNMLRHLNDQVGTNFDVDGYEHQAVFNEDKSCIEMYLVAKDDQQVMLGEERFDLVAGERIHTECSYKYDVDSFLSVARDGGFEAENVWQDEAGWFALYQLRAI